MAKKKGKVRIITLECTEARKAGVPPSRYTTKKNTQTHPERLEKKKYNPNLKKHTVHKEIKQLIFKYLIKKAKINDFGFFY